MYENHGAMVQQMQGPSIAMFGQALLEKVLTKQTSLNMRKRFGIG